MLSSVTVAGLPEKPSDSVQVSNAWPKRSASLVSSFTAYTIVNSVSLFVDQEGCTVVVPVHDDDVIAVLEAVFHRSVSVLSAR